MEPKEIDDATFAFPASVRDLMPAYDEIPDDFKYERGGSSPWVRWQKRWFYDGLYAIPVPKPGIDANKAMRHLSVIQRSFQPKHEHKSAAVAYLASLWFEKPQGV